MIEISPYLTGFIAAYAILFVGTLSPGPSVAMLVGLATGPGRGAALVATFGIALGSATLNILTIAGMGMILSEAAELTTFVRAIGAAYLVYLAYGAFKKAASPSSVVSTDTQLSSFSKYLFAGYLLQVSNPKAIAFWLAISSVGAVAGANLSVILIYIFGGFLISFLGHAAWAVTLSSQYCRAVYNRIRRWVELILGCFFIFAAFKLAASETH